MPVSTVAERLRPESLYDRFVAYREALGMEVIAADRRRQPARPRCAASLARGRLVCLLADRDLTGAGRRGRRCSASAARLPGGPALPGPDVTGAPLVALTLRYRGPLMRLDFSDPVIEPVAGPRGAWPR